MSTLSRVSRYGQRHRMWQPDTRVVAAVSGGSDSVALLHLLHELHVRGECVLDVVAHVNHQIRPESGTDAEFCRQLAARLDVPFVSEQVDVPARAAAERRSIEVVAREARRAILSRVARERRADCVATAHTRDDQCETLLLRIARGTGVRGLGGIAPVRDGRIRPVLGHSRVELQGYLVERGESWREDSTNADLANPRNRVRHELLPYLARHFNPSVHHAIARLADIARREDAWVASATSAALSRVVELRPGEARLDRSELLSLSDAIARRVVRRALEWVNGGRDTALEEVDAVWAVAAGEPLEREVSGVRVEHSTTSVVLIRNAPSIRAPEPFRRDLFLPGSVRLADPTWCLEAGAPQPGAVGCVPLASNHRVAIDAATVGRQLVVRSRQPGDRVRPLGLGGRKKVQDVFVDRKVNRDERDSVPIVTDVHGRIVWVAGHVLGEEFRVTEHTKAVIILELRRI